MERLSDDSSAENRQYESPSIYIVDKVKELAIHMRKKKNGSYFETIFEYPPMNHKNEEIPYLLTNKCLSTHFPLTSNHRSEAILPVEPNTKSTNISNPLSLRKVRCLLQNSIVCMNV